MQDWHSYDGWYIFPGTLAPAGASPRAVAAATLAHVYGDDLSELHPFARPQVAYARWRRIPHRRNFEFHIRQWIARHRRTATRRPR